MKYRYEMHQHTWPCSHCGRANPEELVRVLKSEGYAGCVLTDHFYYGNTGIDRNLEWNEFCKAYEDTYLKAKAVGDELDFDVLFGIEEHIGNGKEVLIYGTTPDFMYKNPQLRDGGLETISKAVHESGGLVIQAHPFRDRDYIPDPDETIDTSLVDGFEIFNSCNKDNDDEKAMRIYGNSGKILVAGSDSHAEQFSARSGIETESRIKDEKQLCEVLKSGKFERYCNRKV